MFEIITDEIRQWELLKKVIKAHGVSLPEIIFAISCHAEQQDNQESFVDALGVLSWHIPDADETPDDARARALFYESEFGTDVLQRSKYAVRIIERM